MTLTYNQAFKIIEVTISGLVDLDAFKNIEPQVKKVLSEHDGVSWLIVINEAKGINAEALWEHFSLTPELLIKFVHIAVVCDEHWIEKLATPTNSVVSGKAHHFKVGQRDTAFTWLRTANNKAAA